GRHHVRAHDPEQASDRLGLRHARQRARHGRLGGARPPDGRNSRLRLRAHAGRALGRLLHSPAGIGTPHAARVNPRPARTILALAIVVASCARLPPPTSTGGPASLAGTWRGRMTGPMGSAPVLLTIRDDGPYHG